MNVSVDYFLLCENGIVGENGKVSIINVYDTIFAERLPALHSSLHFVVKVINDKKSDMDVTGLLSIESPSGKEKLPKRENEFQFKFSSSKPHITLNATIPGVIFEEFGVYTASLLVDGKAIGKRTFDVKQGKGPYVEASEQKSN